LSPSVEYDHPDLNAASILEERNHLIAMSKAKTELIEAEQRRMLGIIIQFASENSSWWRGRLKVVSEAYEAGANIHELIKLLPITTRRQLQDDYSKFGMTVKDSSKVDYKTITTSGSTGRMVQVEKYLPEALKYSSAYSLFEVEVLSRKNGLDTINISVRENETPLSPATKPLSLIRWRGMSETVSSSKRSVPELLDKISQGKFGYVYTNANLIRLLAQEQIRNPRKTKIRDFLSWVDPVDSDLRTLVKKAFGARIIDRYSSEEFGPIAVQCPKNDHMHLIAPYLFLEIVDEDGNSVPEGQLGRVQMTSLTNRTFPLFRYQLGDLVVAGPPCSKINWPTIERVEGRVRDYIEGPNGELRLPRLAAQTITKSPNFLDARIYLFHDKAVALVATARPMTPEETKKAKEELEYAFYLEPGMSEIVVSQEGKWRDIWKRKRYEKIDAPYSVAKLLEFANLEIS
jgi:phenylacetate-CoA ligase